jgi:hypothetical protein
MTEDAAALDALLAGYRDEIVWLLEKAQEHQVKSPLVAADFVHRARNLQAIIDRTEKTRAARGGG